MITEAGTNIASAMNVVWDLMTANPMLLLFVGAAVVTIGFTFFRKARRAAH